MNIWTAIYRISWITLGILIVVGILSMFWPQYRQYKEYQRREAILLEELREEQALLQALKEKQERFQSDPRFVERLAHDMGLVKPDESIFKFMDDHHE